MATRLSGKGSSSGRHGRLAMVLLAGAMACDRPPADGGAPSPAAVEPPAPAAVRVITAAGGVAVWFGDAREGRDSAGTPCVERTLEIRSPAGRRVVPLLYTLDTPTVLDDSTMRARLYTDCRPGPTYHVDLRTGLPVRKDR